MKIKGLKKGFSPNNKVWESTINGNICCYDGEVSLHVSARNNDLKMTQTLFRYYAVANIKNKYGETPIYIALENGNSTNPKIIDLLIKKRSQVKLLFQRIASRYCSKNWCSS